MRGTISKISYFKPSRNGDTQFVRVSFKLEDGTFAMTDLCKTYRNYKRWESLLEVGTDLTGLSLRPTRSGSPLKIDADSFVERFREKVPCHFERLSNNTVRMVRDLPKQIPMTEMAVMPIQQKLI